MKVLIKNGRVFTSNEVKNLDILIEDEKIVKLKENIDIQADHYIDAKGMLVLPGAVDVHTHFSLDLGKYRAADDFLTGTRAAAFGGTTTIVDHIGFFNKDDSLMSMIDKYDDLADHKALIDYSFHAAIQNASDDHLGEFGSLINRGISSLKLYTTYDGRLSDEEILKVLKKAKEADMTVAVHAENHGAIDYLRDQAKKSNKTSPIYHARTRPPETEAEAINRLIYLSKIAGYPKLYFVHVSSQLGLEEIIRARKNGAKNIFAETCPQYLVFDDSYYEKNGPVEGTKFIMAPPLRKPNDMDYLWENISTENVDVIATDHCPFYFESEKSIYANNFLDAPGGAPGVEERLEVVLTEGDKRSIKFQTLVKVLCENPAKVYGLYPKKGCIQVGSDGDIVILKEEAYTISQSNRHSQVDYTNYEGYRSNYKVDTVISRGDIIVEKSKLLAKAGRGKFIKRTTRSLYD